jgi:hypothetical protein
MVEVGDKVRGWGACQWRSNLIVGCSSKAMARRSCVCACVFVWGLGGGGGVVVVNEHMPQGGLSWGRWTLSDPGEGRRGEDRARKTLQTRRATQVRGPREEVKPLLLPI